MTYELAKQLKDAGFPQEIKTGDKYFNLVGHPRMGIPTQQAVHTTFIDIPGNLVGRDNFVKIPTLSELIEACGDSFIEMRRNPETKKWGCADHLDWIKANNIGVGSTPEEAVAKLWLEIQKL